MTTFTSVHVVLSLIGIFSGFVVVFGAVDGEATRRLDCTVSGKHGGDERDRFPFSVPSLLAVPWGRHRIAVSAAGCDLCALRPHLTSAWHRIYVASALIALYLNVFVLIAQAFMKVPALKAMAPTQSEPLFLLTQLVVLVLFVVLAIAAAIRFRTATVRTA